MKRFLKYLLIGTCLLLFTLFNLEANAVYYAQNSRVVKKEAVPFILLDHLWWYLDAESVTKGDYSYNVVGYPEMLHRDKKRSYAFSQHNDPYSDFALVTIIDGTRDRWYLFDDQFQLVHIEQDADGKKLPVTSEEETYARDALQKVSKDLLNKTNAPLINLQLIYDLVHLTK